ncbi:MAG: PD-(D/E)XK nuclease family protein [Candidatus Marinimicrobia bacterium]|nr:PD-(D/E)XK nuclease family protein [Candidatus Neomarinimicrobiota bacterium]MCF7828956.1 PD-(D/E)XK nuclease family protein [Candidatus Neomarinimicrobiota bacterium]MCF7879916.1 PD-(D/E)XK nuclease family protein [Candidatus Neomarinimicrobiota bacterium]
MIELITGPAASGKTEFAVNRTAERLATGEQVAVLLPTQALVNDFRNRLLSKDGFRGSLRLHFYTFYTLVKACIKGSDIRYGEIDDASLHLILESYLEAHAGQYPELLHPGITTGLLHAILDYFGDLADGGITTDTAGDILHKTRSFSNRKRLREIHQLYRDFTGFLAKNRVATREQLFLKALESIQTTNDFSPPNYTFVIDGFYDFNPIQRQFIETILDQSDNALITLLRGDEPVFGFVEKTEDWLRRTLKGKEVSVNSLENNSKTFQGFESLFHRETENAPVHLDFMEADSPYLEIQDTVRSIKKDILTGEYDPEDICVLFRSGDDYVTGIAEGCRREGIPISGNRDKPLDTNPAIRALMQWYEVLFTNFEREQTIQWLQSPYICPRGFEGRDTIGRLDSASVAAQVVEAPSEWIQRLTNARKRAQNEDSWKGTTISGTDIDYLKELFDGLPREKTTSLDEHLVDLRQVIRIVHFRKAISDLSNSRDQLAGRDIRAFQVFERLLESVGSIGAEFDISDMNSRKFVRILRELLRDSEYADEISEEAGITVTNVEQARGQFWKKVYLVGLLDDKFPVRHRAHPLVKLRDRQSINDVLQGGREVIEHRADLREEQLLLYLALTRATESVQVSTVVGSEEMLPSPFYEELHRIYGTVDSENAVPVRRSTAIGLESPQPENSWLNVDLLQHLKYFDDFPGDQILDFGQFRHCLDVTRLRDGNRFTEYDGQVSDTTLQEEINSTLFGGNVSASRFETFYESPFQYFARYQLGLKEPEEVVEELPPDVRGLVLHRIMEQFYRTLPSAFNGKVTAGSLEAGLDHLEAVMARVFEETESKGLPLPEMLWKREKSLIAQYSRNAVEYFATNYPWGTGGLRPDQFEFGFGSDKPESHPPFHLKLNDRELRFSGRADRLDLEPESGVFTVVDYKTSRGKRVKDFWNGRALQLQLYAMAAQDLLENYTEPQRLSYYSFRSGEEDSKIDLTRTEPEQLFRVTKERIGEAVERMEAGDFHPVAGECSRYCPVKQICRCEENRIRRKMAH